MRAWLGIQLATFALVAALPSFAQEPPPERWGLQGEVGADYSNDTNRQLFLPPNPLNSSDYSTLGADVTLLLNGYLKDPKLLPFKINFSDEHGSNAVALGGFRDNIYSFGFDTTFLPDRDFPFHIFYQKSQYGATGAAFGQNSDTSSFGFDWTLSLPRLPHIDVRYLKQSNQLQLITSLTSTSYRLNEFGIDASDIWKGWRWNGGYTDFSTTNNPNAIEGVSGASSFQEKVKMQSLTVNRSFWDKKAHFSFVDRVQWQQEQFLGQSGEQFNDDYVNAQLQINHTPKLSSNYFYNFTHISSIGGLSLDTTEGTGGSVSQLQIPPINSDTFGGGVQYRLTHDLSLFEQFQDYRITAVQLPGVLEEQTSLADSVSGVSYMKRWRGMDLQGRYSGDLQLSGTNLGHHATTFSNDVEGRVAWGSPRRVRFIASGADSRYNLVDELGGFSNNLTARLQAETARIRGWHLQVTAERARIQFLSIGGDVKTDSTNYGAQIDKGRVSLSGSHSTLAGAGALFPAIVSAEQWLSIPLPLNELVATPLLNRFSHVDTAAATLRLRNRLDLSADYMSESDVLAVSQPRFRTADLNAHYRVGKVTIQAGFGEYRIENITIPLRTGDSLNRFYFRITRDFKIF